MRKIASATLIVILLFNLFGYRLVADYIQAGNDSKLEASLDNNHYDESQLVEIKVPVHLPYQTSWSDFERYDGEVELNGILYKFVKRKLSNDTLTLLCIPNRQKMNLQTAQNDFFKNTNDLVPNNSKKSGSSKTVDFNKQVSEYDEHSSLFTSNLVNDLGRDFVFSHPITNLLSTPHISPEQPPDFTLA